MARPDKFLLGLGTIALGLLLGFAVFEAVVLLPVMTYSFEFSRRFKGNGIASRAGYGLKAKHSIQFTEEHLRCPSTWQDRQ